MRIAGVVAVVVVIMGLLVRPQAQAGEWMTPPFSPQNITASGGMGVAAEPWMVNTYKYTMLGPTTMLLVAGFSYLPLTPPLSNTIRVAIPDGYVGVNGSNVSAWVRQANQIYASVGITPVNEQRISFYTGGAFGDWVSPASVWGTFIMQVTRSTHLVMSGQSNAELGAPALTTLHPDTAVSALSGTPISEWNVGNASWVNLVPLLNAPMRAFVWWQGETDGAQGNPHYAADLAEFIARVRRTRGVNVRVVIVRVVNLPEFSAVRAAQEAFVKADSNARLVDTDAYRLSPPGNAHLTDEGYTAVAALIRAAALDD